MCASMVPHAMDVALRVYSFCQCSDVVPSTRDDKLQRHWGKRALQTHNLFRKLSVF